MAGRDGEDIPDAGYGESSRYAAHLDRGWALLDRGDLAAARTSVQHAEEVRPDDPDAAVLMGAISLAEGNADDSLRCYDRAIELDPEYLEPYLAAAQVSLYDLDDPTRALRYCGDALELEGITPFEALELQLIGAEAELSLGSDAAARARLTALPETGELGVALAIAARHEPPSREMALDHEAAVSFLTEDHDGEPLEDEERIDRVSRLLQLALRLARLRVDAGDVDGGVAQLERVIELFPDEADAWYLLGEAGHRGGDPARAAEAGLRTLELDGLLELPRWTPSPAVLQRRVLQILEGAPVPELAALVKGDRALPLFVGEQPPVELVAEGLDPRVVVVVLAGRDQSQEGDQPPLVLTGIAVYRQNLVRFAHEDAQLQAELRMSLFEELAAFLQLPDPARHALGLPTAAPANDAPASPDAPTESEPSDVTAKTEKAEKASRRRGRRRTRTLN
jgi:tetratricopeptide (TPR) repeat protein